MVVSLDYQGVRCFKYIMFANTIDHSFREAVHLVDTYVVMTASCTAPYLVTVPETAGRWSHEFEDHRKVNDKPYLYVECAVWHALQVMLIVGDV